MTTARNEHAQQARAEGDLDGVVALPVDEAPAGRSLREYMRLRAWGIAHPLFTMKSHSGNGESPMQWYAVTAEQAEDKVKGQWDQGRDVELVSVTERARPEITVTDRQLHELVDQTIAALVNGNLPPELFMRAGAVSLVRRDEHGAPVAATLGEAGMLDVLAKAAKYVGTKGKNLVNAPPPRMLAQVVGARLVRLSDVLPPLRGITESPLMRADGSLLMRPGYDEQTKLFYAPHDGFSVPAVAEMPTPDGIEKAVTLIDDMLGDFPFADEAARANAWAAVLTLPLRELIVSLVPLLLVDSPAPGTGKGLLADCVSGIATGSVGAKMPEPGERNDDAEWRKRLLAVLLEGRSVVVLDNIERPLGSASLAAVLTAEFWSDRVLGSTRTVSVPNRTVWLATGNNIRLRGDLPRRCVWIRLDAEVARPWTRAPGEFRHPELLTWVREHRAKLLGAIFTLGRAWIAAGRPEPYDDVPQLGGYERWRRVIGGILRVAEIPGFLANQANLYDQADEDTPVWAAFLAAWRDAYRDRPVTGAEIAQHMRAGTHADLREALPGDLDVEAKSFTKLLGKALARKRGTRFVHADGTGTLHVIEDGEKARAKRWRVVMEEK